LKPKEVIQDLLDAGHSTVLRDEIVDYVGKSAPRMKALMYFFFHDEWIYNQRASWAVMHVTIKQPQLTEPYYERLIENLNEPKHDAVVRNTLRIFQDNAIPESIEGELMDKCFDYLIDTKAANAVRVFSITVLLKIVQKYPELAFELRETLEDQLTYEVSAAFKSRGQKTLKVLKSLALD